ncbi:unnamed protein product [Caenorhabditis sp. 36 PRJEB53466]|nr:unnamed protein product [Caenorhabditis sp. 36 PRJEB53466]
MFQFPANVNLRATFRIMQAWWGDTAVEMTPRTTLLSFRRNQVKGNTNLTIEFETKDFDGKNVKVVMPAHNFSKMMYTNADIEFTVPCVLAFSMTEEGVEEFEKKLPAYAKQWKKDNVERDAEYANTLMLVLDPSEIEFFEFDQIHIVPRYGSGIEMFRKIYAQQWAAHLREQQNEEDVDENDLIVEFQLDEFTNYFEKYGFRNNESEDLSDNKRKNIRVFSLVKKVNRTPSSRKSTGKRTSTVVSRLTDENTAKIDVNTPRSSRSGAAARLKEEERKVENTEEIEAIEKELERQNGQEKEEGEGEEEEAEPEKPEVPVVVPMKSRAKRRLEGTPTTMASAPEPKRAKTRYVKMRRKKATSTWKSTVFPTLMIAAILTRTTSSSSTPEPEFHDFSDNWLLADNNLVMMKTLPKTANYTWQQYYASWNLIYEEEEAKRDIANVSVNFIDAEILKYWRIRPNFAIHFDIRIEKCDIRPPMKTVSAKLEERKPLPVMHWFVEYCGTERVFRWCAMGKLLTITMTGRSRVPNASHFVANLTATCPSGFWVAVGGSTENFTGRIVYVLAALAIIAILGLGIVLATKFRKNDRNRGGDQVVVEKPKNSDREQLLKTHFSISEEIDFIDQEDGGEVELRADGAALYRPS